MLRQCGSHTLGGLPYLLLLLALLQAPALQAFALTNLLLQTVLFTGLVIVPVWRSGRMAYVDIGWPVGLFLIGVQVLWFTPELSARSGAIAAVYLLAGGRMGAMALLGWWHGHFDRELPRYQYQRLRWQRRGWHPRLAMLVEVAVQGLANASVLALPALLLAAHPQPALGLLEGAALLVWLIAFVAETVADRQKLSFNRRMQRQQRRGEHCEEGLWRYCRHPNYFAEWLLWSALALAALPTWWRWAGSAPLWQSILIGLALPWMSYLMYRVLTDYSGARPAEFYSRQKRPGYADYQRRVPMFFPRWPAPGGAADSRH